MIPGLTGRKGAVGLGGPSVVWLTVLFAAPTLLILVLSFKPATPTGGFGPGWSVEAWASLWDPAYATIAWRTLWLSVTATAICLLAAVPTAGFIASRSPRRRGLYLTAVILPFWTSFLVRVFAWKTLLHPQGFIKQILLTLGLAQENTMLMYNPYTVLLVLVYTYLPFAILPIYAAAEKFDDSLLEAARDLGAGPVTAYLRVYLPGIKTGIYVALIMVFIPCLGSYVIPDLVGGINAEMLGNKIAQRAFTDRNLPRAAALASALMAAVLIPMWFIPAWRKRDKENPS